MLRGCCSFVLFAAVLLFEASNAYSAGFQFIDVPADPAGPRLHGAVWSPCAAPAQEVDLGRGLTLPEAVDCLIVGVHLPLVVISHGYHGWFGSLHDAAETLANAGFIVAAINHPADSGPDMSRADELSALTERPTDIKRLIDFMLDSWSDREKINASRIGILGFSRGGYTSLVLIGGNPDWRKLIMICTAKSLLPYCAAARSDHLPTQPVVHDPRIKAAVIADPAFGPLFTPNGLRDVSVPVQLWASTYSGNDMTLDGVSPANVAAIDHSLGVTHQFHVVENATHYAFLAPCHPKANETVSIVCLDAPGFDRSAFHRKFDREVLAFFHAHLQEGTDK